MQEQLILFDLSPYKYPFDRIKKLMSEILDSPRCNFDVNFIQRLAMIHHVPCEWVFDLVDLQERITDAEFSDSSND